MRGALILVLIVLFVSCSERPEKKSRQSASKETSESELNEPNVKTGGLDSISLDWFELKKAIRFLNCGARINSEKEHLQALENGSFYYEYCAHNTNQEKSRQINTLSSDSKLMEVIVVKTNKDIGQYSDQNETLQFLQSQVSSDDLGALNLVGKVKETLVEALGVPQMDTLNTLFYTSSSSALILKLTKGNVVTSFKYYPNWNGETIKIETLKW